MIPMWLHYEMVTSQDEEYFHDNVSAEMGWALTFE